MSQLQQSLFLLQFPNPDVVVPTDAIPHHWPFLFSGLWDSHILLYLWSGSMHKVHISLQELQAVVLILCYMAF